MSLSKLPDLVKRQICSFLDFNEIKKLEQTNKNIQYFLKSYKLDKPKIHKIEFSYAGNDLIECFAILEKEGKYIELPVIEYLRGQDIHTAKIVDFINKFNYIDSLVLCDSSLYTIHNEAGWESVQAKIGRGRFRGIRFNFSKDGFMNFLKQFRLAELTDVQIDPLHVNDKLFSLLSRNGTTLIIRDMRGLEVDITDVTLDTLSEKYLPQTLSLNGLITDISFERIRSMIEAVLISGRTEISWHFGTMKKDQYYQVHRFVYEELKELADRLKIPLLFSDQVRFMSEDRESYRLIHREWGYFMISFVVKKPEELIMQRR